jgi:5-methylcytosine-specific restriction endonuclease McrA
MARKEFPQKVRKAVFARANGKCERCSAVLKTGEGEIDHVLPDGLSGKPELVNAMLLCRVCHLGKSGEDIRSMRRADRQNAMQTGVKRPTGTLQSKGFPQSPKKEKAPQRASLPPRSLYMRKP